MATQKEPLNWVLVGQENEIVVTDSEPESDGISVISEYSLLQDSNNEEDVNNEISDAAETIRNHVQDVHETWSLSEQDQPSSSNTNKFYLNCLQEPVLEITDNDLESNPSEESEVPPMETEPIQDVQLILSHPQTSYFSNYWLPILITTLISSLLVGLFLSDPAENKTYEDDLEYSYDKKVQFPYELAYCIQNYNGNMDNLESAVGYCLDQLSASELPKIIELNLKEKLLEMKEKELLLREMKLLKAELNMRKQDVKNKKNKNFASDKFTTSDKNVENKPNKLKKDGIKAQKEKVLMENSKIKPNVTKTIESSSGNRRFKVAEKIKHNINKRSNYQTITSKKELKQHEMNKHYKPESTRDKEQNKESKKRTSKPQKFIKSKGNKIFQKVKGAADDIMKSKLYKKLKRFFKNDDPSKNDNLKELMRFLSQSSPKTYYDFISNLTKKTGSSSENLFINKTLDGDWYLRLYKNRDEIRKKEHMADWYFDRSYMRKLQRLDKTNWYFDLMSSRDKVRYSF